MEKSNRLLRKILLFISAAWFGMIIAVALEAIIRPRTPELLPEHKGLMFLMTRTVFESFQKVELMLCVVTLFLYSRVKTNWLQMILPAILLLLCLTESFLLMPQLANRALLVYQGNELPPSNVHLFNLAAEGAKLIVLVLIFNQIANNFEGSVQSSKS